MSRKYCDHGYLPKYCAAFLEGLATTLPDPARVVEIGTGTGCGLRAMLLGLRLHDDAHVWTIDIRDCPNLDNEMGIHGLRGQRYTKITGDSLAARKTWNVQLDMLYVDGDHTYPRGKYDIEMWSPLLKVGGIIALDDYENNDFGEVARFTDELLLAHPDKWRFIGQVGRMVAFEKRGEQLPPWILAHSDLVNYSTSVCDPWLWWALGFVRYDARKTAYFSCSEKDE